MEQSYEERGYLKEDFRLFYLRTAMQEPPEWHYHAFHKICVYLGGSAMCYGVEGRSYPLEPGDIVLVPQGCIHRPEIEPGAAYERILLYISPEFLRRAGGEEELERCFHRAQEQFRFVARTGAKNRALLSPLFSLSRAQEEPGFAQELLMRSLLLSFLIALTRGLEEHDLAYASASAYDEKVAAILAYLTQHLSEKISIDALAARFYISKYHMMRRFREETGTSIHTYLSEKRLLAAHDQIAAGTPATDACFRCGYRSYSAFSRAYGKLFGVTPTGRIVQPFRTDDLDE